MTKSTELKQIIDLVEHIQACADIWDKAGVSRVRTITRAAAQIQLLATDALWEQNGFVSRAESDRARATSSAS